MRKMTKFERGIVKAMRARGAEVEVTTVDSDCVTIKGSIFEIGINEVNIPINYYTVVEVGIMHGYKFGWAHVGIVDDANGVYCHSEYRPTWEQVHNAICTL